MDLIVLISFAVLLIGLSLMILGIVNRSKGRPFFYFHEQDGYVQLIYTVWFTLMALCGEFLLGYKNLFMYSVSFGFIAFSIEFIVDWIWFRFFGRRLYNYTKKDLLGFTSWYMIPYWCAGGIYFYAVWVLLGFKDVPIDVNSLFETWSKYLVFSFYLVLVFNGIIEYFFKASIKGKVNKITRYLLFFCVNWCGIIGMLIENDSFFIIYYFLFTAVTGVVLEGIAGKVLKGTFGESFWKYYRFPLLDGSTSLLVLPMWPFVALLAFFLFGFFMNI